MSTTEASFDTTFRDYGVAIGRKMDLLGLAGEQVVRDEASRFAATLIRLSGPRSVQKSKAKIASDVQGKFVVLSKDNPREVTGSGDIEWYAFQNNAIFGVAKDRDMMGASVDDLKAAYYSTKLNKQGRIIAGKRGKQTVYIWQKVLTRSATVAQLAKRLQGHIGRRQAGWLKSWRASGSLNVGNPVPQSVLRHESGSRGAAVDGTKIPGHPEFTLINTATGSSKLQAVMAAAAKIRTGAISKDLALYIRGVKKV